MHHEDKEREHRQSRENVGQQHAGEPRQRRSQGQDHGNGEKPQWLRHAEHPQGQMQDP
jgi:hypothetical protein